MADNDITSKARQTDPARRKALAEMGKLACVGALACAGLAGLARQSQALPAAALRPPGALPEADFLSACVRCGLCVRSCPYKTLRLAELGDGPAIGTPFFNARAIPCEMCDDIPCVKACPTGALTKSLTTIEKARMGLAALVDRENCLNMQGLRCDVCYRVCPAIDKAITLERTHNTRTQKHAVFEPVVHSDACTGCGKCEKSCVLQEAAIKVLPIALAKGEMGAHYKLGWEEKKKAGQELVPGIKGLPTRLPEPPGGAPLGPPEVPK